MALYALRTRMPLIAFVLLAVVCLVLLGFTCACLSDHPTQALERALATLGAFPAIVEVWSITAAIVAAAAFIAARNTPAIARLALSQRLLL
jgi:hypothetical protein